MGIGDFFNVYSGFIKGQALGKLSGHEDGITQLV